MAIAFAALAEPELLPARVVAVHRGGVMLAGAVRGPAVRRGKAAQVALVGDWVAARPLGDRAAVEHVLPRRGLLARRGAGKSSAAQAVAANVDRLIAVTTPDADFSPRRMERYLAVAWDGGAVPVLVVAKSDLVDDPAPFVRALGHVAPGVRVLALSARTGAGVEALRAELPAGITGALVGSSGVGKSTLVNALVGAELQATQAARAGDAKGRHTTTTRELFALPDGGGLLIDTPGMRAIGLAVGAAGVEAAFGDVEDLAAGCHFRDCKHVAEPGCAVVAAAASGALGAERLDSWRRLAAEQAYEERRRDARQARAVEKSQWRSITRANRARARREAKLRED